MDQLQEYQQELFENMDMPVLTRISKRGVGSHQKTIGENQEWITPKWITDSLGTFDLDPCSPVIRPWDTALNYYTVNDDGLSQDWFGRVWLNPPYYRYQIGRWLQRMCDHKNGIALTFARTETYWFQKFIFDAADSILFMDKRVTFCYVDGKPASANGGAPNVLVGYDQNSTDIIYQSGIGGHFQQLNKITVICVGISPTWLSITTIAVKNYGDNDLKPIYDMVERLAPDKVIANKHWKEKIRQKIQLIRKQK